MKKVGICGIYGIGPNFSGGQPVKVRMIVDEFRREFGEAEVELANTHNWKKRPFRLLVNCFKLFKSCRNVIMMPAHNGVRVFTPLFLLNNMIFHRKIHYIVIGGWLPDYLRKDKRLRKNIKKFAGIYVETESMKNDLESIGLNNVYIMNNFKKLSPIPKESLLSDYSEPYKLCFFSRIVKEKGVEDAIHSLIAVNSSLGREVFHLDLYGFVDENYKEKFENVKKDLPSYIRYCGVVNPDKSVEVLKDYFMQLFPTRYKTEGIPGSIVDSYYAGVPVLASKWNSFNDVIIDGETGVGFELYNNEDLICNLKKIADNPDYVINMKENCIKKSVDYSSEFVIKEFIRYLQ